MKKTYTKTQIESAISQWQEKLNESISSGTEAKLKDAAKKFAKWFGEQIKSGQAQRFEDGSYDALVAIKNTIKMNSSVKNMIKFLKSEKNTVVPGYAIEGVAEVAAKEFIANVFDGSKALVEELNRAIDILENYHFEATADYVEALAKAIQDEKDKKLQNLKKSTEQFNYFANCVFGIWKRDPEIAKTLGKIPQLPTNAKDLEALRAEFNELAGAEDSDGEQSEEDISAFLHDSEEVVEEEPISEEEFMSVGEEEVEEKTEEVKEEAEEAKEDKVEEAEMKGNIVGALISALKRNCQDTDQLLFRINPAKEECFVFDIYSKNGYAVIDLVKGRPFDPKEI